MKKLLLVFAVFAICSCSFRFDENAVRDTTAQYFTSIQNQRWTRDSTDWTKVNHIYPNFSKIPSYQSFTNYTIEDVLYEKGKGICVNVDLECFDCYYSPSHCKIKRYF